MNKKETEILNMLVSGAKVREIKNTLKCGAEIIKRIRTEFENIYPQIKILKRTRTRTKTRTKNKNKKDFIPNAKTYQFTTLLNHDEILFLDKMYKRMLKRRSILKNEEHLFDSIINKLKNF